MKNLQRIKTVAFILMCVPFCGGWAAIPAAQDPDRYVGGELLATYATETIPYVSRQLVSNINTDNWAPCYRGISGIENECGAVAGANIVGFYDKYYENLIPGWKSYYSTGTYRFQDGERVPALINDLYYRMQTNVVAPGVSEDEFKSGLNSYVVDHGYSLSYTSLGNGNNFNYDAFKTAVNNNQVSVLFIQPSELYTLAAEENEDVVDTSNISGNHIMIAFGYYEVTYTLTNGTRTDKYLRVSTGFPVDDIAFYKVGSYVDAAYIVKVF